MNKDEALKMRKEQDEYWSKIIKKAEESLAQPAPKNCTPLDEYIAEMEKDPEIKQLLDIAREDVKKWSTHPSPAPSWQGLSDDEIQNIADETDKVFATSIFWVNAFARAIEQALRIKNDSQS